MSRNTFQVSYAETDSSLRDNREFQEMNGMASQTPVNTPSRAGHLTNRCSTGKRIHGSDPIPVEGRMVGAVHPWNGAAASNSDSD